MNVIQLSVFLENKSGRLAETTSLLSQAGINIRALSLVETMDYGVLRMIVDKPAEAKRALMAAGMAITETRVIAVEMPDKPGALAEVVNVLTSKGINIEYCYAFVGRNQSNALVIFRVHDLAGAVAALQETGQHVLSAAELGEV
jgi:hypothetical protein